MEERHADIVLGNRITNLPATKQTPSAYCRNKPHWQVSLLQMEKPCHQWRTVIRLLLLQSSYLYTLSEITLIRSYSNLLIFPQLVGYAMLLWRRYGRIQEMGGQY